MTGGQGGSQQPKRSFALRSNVHAPTGAVATVARCRADKGAPLSRAMVAAVDQQLTCHNRRNRRIPSLHGGVVFGVNHRSGFPQPCCRSSSLIPDGAGKKPAGEPQAFDGTDLQKPEHRTIFLGWSPLSWVQNSSCWCSGNESGFNLEIP